MKHQFKCILWNSIFIFLITMNLFSCEGLTKDKNHSSEEMKDSIPEKIEVNIPVQNERMYQDVSFLTSLEPARNYENLESLEKAIHYIQEEFEKLDFETKLQEYQAMGNTYKNVIATYNPKKGTRLVIGAHYDVCDDQPGADDNASAVAGLLEIARLLAELKPDLDYQIDFVAYSLEEPPFFGTKDMGSAVHAQSLKAQNIDLKAMICLEMIGYYSDEPDSQEYPLPIMANQYPSVGNFIAVIGNTDGVELTEHMKNYMLQVGDIPVESINAPEYLTGIDFSDHRNYWALGYPAVMINNTAFYRNPNYHEKTDTIETLDFDRMVEVVRGVYWAVVNF